VAEDPKAPDLGDVNKRLLEQNLGIAREIQTRALPRLGEMTDALNAFALNAKGGNVSAKEMLKDFFEALEAARGAAEGLDVVRKGQVPILLKKT
jgi:hypothetical protein